jgi:hypothetical protein
MNRLKNSKTELIFFSRNTILQMFDDIKGTLLDFKKFSQELKLECKGRFDTCTRGIFIFVIASKKLVENAQTTTTKKNKKKQ